MTSAALEPEGFLVVAVPVGAYLICLPVFVYALYQLKADWNETYIVKRHRWIILWFIVFASVLTLVKLPYSFFLIYFCPDIYALPKGVQFIIAFENATMNASRIVFNGLFPLRLYLLH